MENRNLAIGALAVAGIGIYAFSKGSSAEPITGATPFTSLGQQETPTQKKTRIVDVESLVPSLPAESVWGSRGKTFTFEHPLAASNPKYSTYKLKAKLVVDILQSGAYESWEEVPDSIQGDYTWELSRQGGSWTVKTNADDIRGQISKSLLSQSVDSIKPTFNSILSSFGGYKSNYPAVNMGHVQIQSGSLTETGGSYRYVNSNGTKVSKQQIVLDLSGNQIAPEPLQMQVKCSGQSWNNVGSSVVVIGSLIAENENKTVKFFPAEAISGSLSGLSYGCTIPQVTKTLPKSIRVVDATGTQVSIDDLAPSVITTVSVENIKSVSAKGYINTTLFSSFGFPKVQKDGGGYFIMWGIPNKDKKAYISELIPGFNALYQRRQVQCQCPGGSKKAGQTVTIYDTNNCPSFNSTSEINKHCGGASSGTGSGANTGGGLVGGIGGGLVGGSVGSGSIGGMIGGLGAETDFIMAGQSFIIR